MPSPFFPSMPFFFLFVFFLPSTQRQGAIPLIRTIWFGEGKRCKLPPGAEAQPQLHFLLHCMLAKRICLQHFRFFGQRCNERQNKSQSRLMSNLESHRGHFRGSPRGTAPPIVQETFAASVFGGVSSGQRLQQNSARTLLWQHSAVAAASSFQTSTDCWPSIGTLYLMKCEFERVFWNLHWTTRIE